jgi:NADH-quinone oxidoreductase subunit K
MNLTQLLLLASLLFCIGIYGVLTRRHAIALLLSLELMLNAGNIAFVAFARMKGGEAASGGGQLFALFALAITVAEAAVGLALILLLYRRYGDTVLDLAREARE